MAADPPIGTPITTDPCGPCAGPPDDCLETLESLQAQVCALSTNYLDTIQKYGQLLSKIQAGQLSIKDLVNEIAILQQEINDLGSGNCSGLGVATKADAMIACFGGQQKAIAAPSALNNFLASFQDTDGKYRWGLNEGPWRPNLANILTGVGAGVYPVTLPNFPASGTVWGVFEGSISDVISGQVSLQTTVSSQTVVFCRDTSGTANQNYGATATPLSGAAFSFTVVKTGAAAAVSNLLLLGYLVSP